MYSPETYAQLDAPASKTYLIEPDRLVRAVKGEGRNLDIEAITMLALHLIAARHDAGRRRERHTARIFKRVTGLKTRLFADNARAANLA